MSDDETAEEQTALRVTVTENCGLLKPTFCLLMSDSEDEDLIMTLTGLTFARAAITPLSL